MNSMKDREFRAAFNVENVYTTICFQLRALREQRGLSQGAFGRNVRMAQERISILEDPNAETKPMLNTLLRLADGLDVGLEVRFVPFSKVLDRATHTDMQELQVDSFDVELPLIEQAVAYEAALENELGDVFHDLARRGLDNKGTPNVSESPSLWLEEAISATQNKQTLPAPKKQPSSEHNQILIRGELANAASVGATG
jgi:transcriptional regulator with XRE-family HTH domain